MNKIASEKTSLDSERDENNRVEIKKDGTSLLIVFNKMVKVEKTPGNYNQDDNALCCRNMCPVASPVTEQQRECSGREGKSGDEWMLLNSGLERLIISS